MKSIAAIAVVLVTSIVVLASPPTTQNFSIAGTIDTTETGVLVYPTLTATAYGVGQASHLGRYALVLDVVVDLISETSVGTFTINAANGDQLTGTLTGVGADTDDENVFLLTETLTIRRGTGRFKGASGTVVIRRFGNAVTLLSFGTLDGTLTVPSSSGHQP